MLHPYKGWRQDEHFGRTAYNSFAGDKSTYDFNALGFRGEEFDAEAQVKLFVCGCSFTFGIGVELEESWPFLLKQRLAAHRDLAASSVNLLNFSEAGASNDYIARTLIEQSTRVRPDLIVAGFTQTLRFELLDEEMTFRFNPPVLQKYASAGGKFAEMAKRMEFVFLGTDEIQEKVRTIKNMLLLQYFSQSRSIPFIFLGFWGKDLASLLSTPMTRPLYEEIDHDLVVPLSDIISATVDRAADGLHAGPRSQELIAAAAWRIFEERYL
jgi:hypothetical protein